MQGSVEQVAVTNAPRGVVAKLLTSSGKTVATVKTDAAGAALFRDVQPGTSYVVRVGSASVDGIVVTTPADTPPQAFYSSQTINDGFGYLKTRDGTLLSINVKLPGPAASGPYPTVIEYSGYDPSNPAGQQPASTIAQTLGYATVGVNLRGTGCSGGSWRYFETLQSLDGYDAVETIAAQPWVAQRQGRHGRDLVPRHHAVVRRADPSAAPRRDHAAVGDRRHAPRRSTRAASRTTASRSAGRRTAPPTPRPRVRGGPPTGSPTATRCARRTRRCGCSHPTCSARSRACSYDDGARSDALAPATFVNKIDVPVFLAGSWQDEETGAHFADMLGNFAPGVPVKFTLMNGVHSDALGPAVIARWAEFLDFYVARRIPTIPDDVRTLADGLLTQFYGPGVKLPPDRFTAYPDYASALAAYQQELPVRVLVGVGAGGAPGTPVPEFELSFPSWPPPTTQATTWYFGADGTLVTSRPTDQPTGNAANAADSFTYDPSAFPRTIATKQGGASAITSFVGSPSFDWKPVPEGQGRLVRDRAARRRHDDARHRQRRPMAAHDRARRRPRGHGVRGAPRRQGDLRAERVAPRARGSSTRPRPPSSSRCRPTSRRTPQPLPKNKATLVRVPTFPFGHEFAAGSRVRIVVQPPGGNRPSWAFDTVSYKSPPTVEIVRTKSDASKVVLPIIPGAAQPEPAFACDSLRGQPCRPYSAG